MNTEADCIALYDWKAIPSWHDWLSFCESFFKELHLAPDTSLFGRSANKLKQFEFDDAIASKATQSNWKVAQIYSTRPDYKQLIFGWKACAAMTFEDQTSIVLGWEAGLLDRESLLEKLLLLTDDCYAIGYRRPFKKGPDVYAYGMASGLEYGKADMDEKDRIGAWFRERIGENRHTKGMLRDVFPNNVLMDCHINRKIGATTLKDWVQLKSGRGCLTNLRSNQWLWDLSEEEIRYVRPVLSKEGLLIADSK